MSLDIVIFAVVAAVLIARLRSVLGTRHGNERDKQNPFDQMRKGSPEQTGAASKPDHPVTAEVLKTENPRSITVDDVLIKSASVESVRSGIQAIANADKSFDLQGFLDGARMAFQMITEAFIKGDKKALKPLLAEDLYAGFEQAMEDREKQGLTAEYILHRIKEARLVEAQLKGVMAYITIDFDVEKTSTLKDDKGQIIDGDPDKINEIHDIWTFARDVRLDDPNWELVATRLGDG